MCGVNPSVETLFKFAHLRSKDFSFQTKSAHSDSPSAGEAGELCCNSAKNVQSETFDVREVMARFAFQHIGRTNDTPRETCKFV